MKETGSFADVCMHLGDEYDRYLGAIVPPIFQNTIFTRKAKDHGYTYSKVNNPTIEILERKLATLEHAEAARIFSSGMAAISSTLVSLLQKGDHVVALKSIYYPTSIFIEKELGRYGVEVDFVADFSIEELESVVKPNTVLFYFESPSSNIFKILDIKAITDFAKSRNIKTAIDNTWSTPLYQNPLDLGVDYVIHSATKYIGGHSDVTAGVVMGTKEAIDRLRDLRSSYGACLDPMAAWLLIRSLRTLELRMERHSQNAKQVAAFLESSDRVKRVFYPGLQSHLNHGIALTQMKGFSGLLSYTLDTDNASVVKYIKQLTVFEEGPSWGGFESIMNTPGLNGNLELMEFLEVPNGLVRMSIGLENIDTILSDIERALKNL